MTFVRRRGGGGVTFGAGEGGGGGGKGFSGETVLGFDGGFGEVSLSLGCWVVDVVEEEGFVADSIPEQPNKKKRTEMYIRKIEIKALDK